MKTRTLLPLSHLMRFVSILMIAFMSQDMAPAQDLTAKVAIPAGCVRVIGTIVELDNKAQGTECKIKVSQIAEYGKDTHTIAEGKELILLLTVDFLEGVAHTEIETILMADKRIEAVVSTMYEGYWKVETIISKTP